MELQEEVTPVLSDATFNTINKSIVIPANILTAALGIISNVVNIMVFAKMSPMDTMTISLIGLAISDLLFSCITLPHFIISAFLSSGIQVLWNVDLKSLLYVAFVWQRPLFHKISITITTFVSCERSLCVVKPFLVKRIFTRKRVIIIIVAIFIVLTGLLIPVYSTGSLRRARTSNGTGSIIVLHLAPERAIAEQIALFSLGFPLVLMTQVIVFVSSVFMASGLWRHRQYRQAATAASQGWKEKDHQNNRSTSDTCKTYTDVVKNCDINADVGSIKGKVTRTAVKPRAEFPNSVPGAGKPKGKPKSNQSVQSVRGSTAKEDRLIQTVLVLAVMNVVLNTPHLVFYIYYNVNLEFRVNERFGNVYMVTADIATFLQALNAMLNVVVYLVLNTKFRAIFTRIFSFRRHDIAPSKNSLQMPRDQSY